MQATEKMPDLAGLRSFDTCVTLGRGVHSSCSRWLGAEDVLHMMDRFRIAEALVHDHHARLVHPRANGNRRLLEEIKGLPRLHPAWVLEPPKRQGGDAARALVEEMLAAGVRVARLRMRPVAPLPWLWEDLCSVLEEHRVPCFLDFGDVSTRGDLSDQDVNGIREIALAHPELQLVLSHVMGYLGLHPAVVPLIRRVKNVHLDITGIIEYWREVAHEVGPERVFFATGAPFTDTGILISNVQYARGLDEKAKRMISGGNIRRLMEGVR